jgi:hypothetical protein
VKTTAKTEATNETLYKFSERELQKLCFYKWLIQRRRSSRIRSERRCRDEVQDPNPTRKAGHARKAGRRPV